MFPEMCPTACTFSSLQGLDLLSDVQQAAASTESIQNRQARQNPSINCVFNWYQAIQQKNKRQETAGNLKK